MEDTDVALKKIAKGAGIFLIGLVISKVLAYTYRVIIARMGVEQYGLLSIALAVFNILTVIAILGMGDGVVRFVSFYKGKSDYRRIKGVIISALKFTLPLSLAFAVPVFFASNWIAVILFHNNELSILFKIFAFCIPLDVLRNIFFASMKGFQKIEYEVYGRSIGENIAKVLLTLGAVYLGLSVNGVAAAYVTSVFISFVLSFYFSEKKVFSVIHTSVIPIKSDKELLVYSLPLLFTSFVFLIIQWTDTLMLGSLRTVAETGLYNVALPTASLLYLFPSAIRTLFFPVLNELYAQDKKEAFESAYRAVIKWILTINSILFVFLAVFSHQIIGILFGEAYVKDKIPFFGGTISLSVLALIILSSGMILGYLLVPSKDILMILSKTKFIFLNTLTGASLNILLNYLLIPPYGIIGSAIATGISYFVMAIIIGIKTYLITRINPFKPSCIKIILTALFMLLIMILFKVYSINSITYLIIAGLGFLAIYLILLLIVKSFDEEDIIIIKSILKKLNITLGLNKN